VPAADVERRASGSTRHPQIPSRGAVMSALGLALLRAARLLEVRLAHLEDRIAAGEEAAWPPYLEIIEIAAKLDRQLTPGSRGELLTTKQMAARLAVTPKTLLKRKARGEITPAQQAGRLIRWKGTEEVR
jgi:hypothetical protein